jgi:hypothetical protein
MKKNKYFLSIEVQFPDSLEYLIFFVENLFLWALEVLSYLTSGLLILDPRP